MNLTEHDAYALRRAVSMLDIPAGLTLSPLVKSLLASLDWQHDRTHWAILQQILTRDPESERAGLARRSQRQCAIDKQDL